MAGFGRFYMPFSEEKMEFDTPALVFFEIPS